MKERYQLIEEKNDELNSFLKIKKLESVIRPFHERFETSWVYHDNALEGTVYTQTELLAALKPGSVATEASMMPLMLEIRNHKACIEFIKEEAKAAKRGSVITVALLKKIHDILCGNTPEAQAARALIERRERTEKELAKERERLGYRKDMPLHRTYFHEIAQPSKIMPMLEKLTESMATPEIRDMHAIHVAAYVQYQFMQAFPYVEYSGKVARMASNLLLIRGGFLPAIIHAIDRQRYYEAFRGGTGAFRTLFMDALENCIDSGLKYFKEVSRSRRR